MQLELLTPTDDPHFGGGFFLRFTFDESERTGLPSAIWLADASPSPAMDFAILDLDLLLIPWDGVTDPPEAMRGTEIAFVLVAKMDEDNVEIHPDMTPDPDYILLQEALQKGLTEEHWSQLGQWHRIASWGQAEHANPEMLEPGFVNIAQEGPVRVRFDSLFWLPDLTVLIEPDVWQVQDIYSIDAPGTDVVVEIECTADSLEQDRELTDAEVDALLEDPDALFNEDSSRLTLRWNCTTGVVEELARKNTQVTVDEMRSKIVAAMPGLPARFLRRHALMTRVVEQERNRLSEEMQAFSTPMYPEYVAPEPLPEFLSGPTPIARSTPKVGRNDPCPCGSGKKSKKCCG